jgi:hypothetical protein
MENYKERHTRFKWAENVQQKIERTKLVGVAIS